MGKTHVHTGGFMGITEEKWEKKENKKRSIKKKEEQKKIHANT